MQLQQGVVVTNALNNLLVYAAIVGRDTYR
jgi:hypothetical protein